MSKTTTKKGFKLVHFDYTIEFNEAVKKMKALGLRPAGREELWDFDREFPKEKREYPIVALDRCSPLWDLVTKEYVAYFEPGRPELLRKLTGWGDYWDSECRFLAVCE